MLNVIVNDYPVKSCRTLPVLTAKLVKIRGYSVRLSGMIVLIFNTLITKHSFIAGKLETIFILPFFSTTHKILYIAGHLLSTDDKYSVHHDHIWAVLTMCL